MSPRALLSSRAVVTAGVMVYVVGGMALTERWHNHRRHPGGVGVARCQASMRCPAHARTRAARVAGRRVAGYDEVPAAPGWELAA